MRAPKPEKEDSLHANVGAIVLAAGESLRMHGVDKAFAPLLGRPLAAYSLEVLQGCRRIGQIVFVLGRHNLEMGRALVGEMGLSKVSQVCLGGPRRQDSVRMGLRHLSDCEWVLVHDSARPCLDKDMVLRGLEAALETGAAVAAVPVKDTIKVSDPGGLVVDTPLRGSLWAAQTPQIFREDLLLEAHASVHDDMTDDAAMLERLGYKVKLFQGSYDNIKVTTPRDLLLAEAILSTRNVQR